MRFSLGLCLSLAVLLAVDPPLRAVGRYDQFTAKFKQAPDRAAVLAAGYLGGSGTEWFVGGGFQPDGTVVIAGVTLGPKLEFGTVGVAVLGKDSAAPGIWTPKPLIRNGKPELEKDGTPKFAPAAWTDEAATAFVLRLSADMKTVVSASRFPWRSAGVTAAVVDDVGDIYLAGPAGVGIASLGNVREDKVAATDARNGAVQRTCLVKLDAAAANVLWVRSLAGFSGSPTLELVKGGKLRFASQDLRTYDKLGNVERAVVIPGGLDAKTAVHPTDGTYARGGEKNWPTGREPYRDPHLYIHKPDGKILYEFYNWDGPYVGLENR